MINVIEAAAVPEPATLALPGVGLAGLVRITEKGDFITLKSRVTILKREPREIYRCGRGRARGGAGQVADTHGVA